jgi:hypothetical protein
MYTESGKNHLNQMIAGNAAALATHIYVGIDGFDTAGDAQPFLSDRHYSPFVSAKLPIINRTVVNEFVIFATSHDTSKVKSFLANNMALVYENNSNANRVRIMKNVFNNFGSDGWTGGVAQTEANTPPAWFNDEGGIIIAPNSTVLIEGALGLRDYKENDYLSIPIFWIGGEPNLGEMTVTFYFTDNGVQKTYNLMDSVETVDAGTRFRFTNGVPSLFANGVIPSLDITQPDPHVWQMRLGAGTTNKAAFLANLANIWKVSVQWFIPTAEEPLMYMGSPQITPDYDADNSSVVISHSPLNKVLINSGTDAMSLEYRIVGVT